MNEPGPTRARYIALVSAVLLLVATAYCILFVLTVPLGPETRIVYLFLSLVFVPFLSLGAMLSGWRLLEGSTWSKFGATLGTISVAVSALALLQWFFLDFLMSKNNVVVPHPWKALGAALAVAITLYVVSRRYTRDFVSKYPGRGYLLFCCFCFFVGAFHAFQFIPKFAQKGEEAASLAHFPAEDLLYEPAPGFSLRGPHTEKYDLVSARGKPVLLNFWTTWCGPCKAELPHLQNIAEELGSERFTFLAINADLDTARVKPFVDSLGYTFKTLYGREIMHDYKVQQFPVTFLVDKKGIVRRVYVGYFKSSSDRMKAVLEKLINE
jgi:thiol-disulfide isomerase/thioredoxin